MLKLFTKAQVLWLTRDRGASAVEYGLIVAAIAAVIVALVFTLGGKIKSAFDTTCDAIGTGQNSGAC
jgi:pilus assembly protein Flp/PilA